MIERDAAIARYEGGRLPHAAPVGGRVGGGGRARARPTASQVTAEVTPHHLTLTDEAVRSLDPRFKMNPPLRGERDRAGADRGPALGRDRLHRDRPRAALARGEGGAVRAGADGRDRARDRVRGALHGPRAARACSSSTLLVERMTAGGVAVRPAGADARAGRAARTSASSTSTRAGRSARPATRAAPRTPASPAASCSGRVLMTVAAGAVAYRERGFAIRLADEPTGSAAAAGEAAVKLDRGARGARGGRRAGGVPAGGARLRPGRRTTSACWCRARSVLGLPVLVTEQYPKGLGHTVPEVAEHLDGVEPIEKVVLQRGRRGRVRRARSRDRARPGAALRDRVARVREPDRRGPARRRARGARRAGRGHARAPRRTATLGLHKMERSGRRADERRDGAVRAAARRPARRSSRRSRGSSNERAYVLLEDGTALRREAVGADAATRSARSSSTPP